MTPVRKISAFWGYKPVYTPVGYAPAEGLMQSEQAAKVRQCSCHYLAVVCLLAMLRRLLLLGRAVRRNRGQTSVTVFIAVRSIIGQAHRPRRHIPRRTLRHRLSGGCGLDAVITWCVVTWYTLSFHRDCKQRLISLAVRGDKLAGLNSCHAHAAQLLGPL